MSHERNDRWHTKGLFILESLTLRLCKSPALLRSELASTRSYRLYEGNRFVATGRKKGSDGMTSFLAL